MEVIFDYLLVVWLQRPIATIYFSDVYANSSAAGGFISITERSIAPSFFCCAGASFIFLSICNIECRKYNSLFTRLFLSADRKHSQTLSLTYSFYDFYVDLLNTSCLSASQALLTPNVVPRFQYDCLSFWGLGTDRKIYFIGSFQARRSEGPSESGCIRLGIGTC